MVATDNPSVSYTRILLVIVLVQWSLFAYVLKFKAQSGVVDGPLESVSVKPREFGCSNASVTPSSLHKSPIHSGAEGVTSSSTLYGGGQQQEQWEGVALVMLHRRPQWYHKRYMVLFQNALANTPITWAIQLIADQDFLENTLKPYHHGLERFLQHPRVVVTFMPPDAGWKPPNVYRQRWIWEQAVGERVLIVSGDGALCANSIKSWSDFDHLDYVGMPWDNMDGIGGSGLNFSLRKRSSMLAALDHPKPERDNSNDSFLIKTLLRINEETGSKYRVASIEETLWFGGNHNVETDEDGAPIQDQKWGPMALAGMQGGLPNRERNFAIGRCPEIKNVFPVISHPDCFSRSGHRHECAESLGFNLTCPTP